MSTSPMKHGWYLHKLTSTLRFCSPRCPHPHYDLHRLISRSVPSGFLINNGVRVFGLVIFIGLGLADYFLRPAKLSIWLREFRLIIGHGLVFLVVIVIEVAGVDVPVCIG